MHGFEKEFEGVVFVGKILDNGPYPTRLAVSAKAEEDEDEEAEWGPLGCWPEDDWISEACGEPVAHWTSGEGECEEIYLPVTEGQAAAENARLMFGP